MLAYSDLTPAQRKWVDLVEFHYPKMEQVTNKQLHEMHEFFKSLRETNPKYKCSFPIWLIMNNQVSRGVYKFPASEEIEDTTDQPVVSDLEQLYLAELAKFDIKPKKAR